MEPDGAPKQTLHLPDLENGAGAFHPPNPVQKREYGRPRYQHLQLSVFVCVCVCPSPQALLQQLRKTPITQTPTC